MDMASEARSKVVTCRISEIRPNCHPIDARFKSKARVLLVGKMEFKRWEAELVLQELKLGITWTSLKNLDIISIIGYEIVTRPKKFKIFKITNSKASKCPNNKTLPKIKVTYQSSRHGRLRTLIKTSR